jgi:ATP-binding cassette subfamily C (CFTR/MRP) protein 1
VVDEELQQTISQLSNSVAACLGAIGGIAGSTKGTFLILLVPLIFLYFKFQQFFRAGNTTVARLESVSRSPIYADFSQALIGANSIRAYMQQTRFVTSLNKALNHNSIANITQQLSSQWLAIRLDFLGKLLVCVPFLFVLFSPPSAAFYSLFSSFSLRRQYHYLLHRVTCCGHL